ncbi:MAG: polyprenol monophosphomannose synthase [Planctomycetia bacterium]
MKTLIMLCTYNERDNVKELIPQLLSLMPQASIVVIDDNSPDGTGQIVEQLRTSYPSVHLLHRPHKQGLGTATIAGFRYAIEQGFDYLLNMDADFSHPPKYVPMLFEAVQTCDVSIASRYVRGGGVMGWTLRRKLMSWLINFWARRLLGLKTKDNSGSFRCYRVSLLQKADWTKVLATGYAIQEEILFRCRRVGGRMLEIPFFFEDRRYGTTKINLRECWTAVWVIFRLGMQRIADSPASGVPVRGDDH